MRIGVIETRKRTSEAEVYLLTTDIEDRLKDVGIVVI